MNKTVIVLRSGLFALFQLIITPPFTLISVMTCPLAPLTRYRVISQWARCLMWALRVFCGVRYQVIGAEHIPTQPCIIFAKHQSAWETLAFQLIFPPQVWVLKRELLYIPFFGWGLAMLSPIAINRKQWRSAITEMVRQGQQRLRAGFCIVVFPEGTRIAPGARGTYRAGGAHVAIQTQTPLLPVAHNAGWCWGRHSFLKRPGLITVHIGPPLTPHTAEDAKQLTQRAAEWIEAHIPPPNSRLPSP